jgi:MerR family transcriptional regulator/heat shock protein HspR
MTQNPQPRSTLRITLTQSVSPADKDAPVYVISVVAELTGVHPQTLRLYDRRGLLAPSRTTGGTRRYSQSDLARLTHITELTAQGLNLAGVRRVLELEAELEKTRQQKPDDQSPDAKTK